MKLAVAFTAVAVSAPVHTLAPIGFGLHYKDAHGSSAMLVALSPVKSTPRLAVLRSPRRPSDAVPPLVETTVIPGSVLALAVDVEAAGAQHAATLRRNGFLLDLPGLRARQVTSVLVTTKDGRRFRLPLDRKEFTR